MTSNEYTALATQLGKLQEQLGELQGLVVSLVQSLHGKVGEVNGAGIGVVGRLAEIKLDLARLSEKVEGHLHAHAEQDDRRDSRMWELFKMFATPLAGVIVGAAMVRWGFK